MLIKIVKVIIGLLTQPTSSCFQLEPNSTFLKIIVYHHLLNLQPKTESRGSPNNNDYDVPEGYERHAHRGNMPLLFSSG